MILDDKEFTEQYQDGYNEGFQQGEKKANKHHNAANLITCGSLIAMFLVVKYGPFIRAFLGY